MDNVRLFHACKIGDLQKVIYLEDEKEVEINVIDKWDSTPLYYACLCGHKLVVKYLLDHGAKCEANTFEGERCLYGALNDEIRNLLKSYHMISSKTMRRDVYDEFLRRIRNGNMYEDVEFYVHGAKFPAHKCILSSRCDYFASQFKTRWKNRRVIELNNQMIQPLAFENILHFIYTGCIETHVDNIDDCITLGKQCQLQSLLIKIEHSLKKKYSLESMKPSVHVTMLVIEPEDNSVELQMDLGQLAQAAIPPALNKWVIGELPFDPETYPPFHDVCFQVEGHTFNCHKVFFCGRSDYFKALLEDHFGESYQSGDIPVIRMNDVSVEVFLRVLHYMYQDRCELSESIVYDVLCAAEMYLLPGLKTQCARSMVQFIDNNNTVPILQTARLFSLPKLESQCAEYIANTLDFFLSNEDFMELVKDDARSIKERQATDSIDIIDEIRYYITNLLQMYSDMEEANEKLRQIDDFLYELGIDG